MWAWGLWMVVAWAGPDTPAALAACCDAAGSVPCPASLSAVGPGSNQEVSPDGTRVTGVWTLSCTEGATFEPDATLTTARPFPPSSIVTPLLPAAMKCFQATCRLPAGSCLDHDGSRVKLAVCADRSDAPEAVWRARPRAAARAAVVGGRVLQAEASAGRVAATDAVVRTGPPRPPTQPVDATVPDAPPHPCRTRAAMRTPSNQQVDEGNEAMVGGDLALALDKYRAAITINRCNAFAWAALGDALLQSGHPTQAGEALDSATKLMPTNVHAWTVLGRAREQIGDAGGAATAYQTALQHDGDHAPAAQGLDRVQ